MYRLTPFSRFIPVLILFVVTACGYAPATNQPDFKPIRPNSAPTPIASTAKPVASPASIISDQVGLVNYTHSTGRFSLSYPANWRDFEQANGVVLIDPTDQGGFSVFFADVGQKYSKNELNQYLVTFVTKNFVPKDSQLTPLSQETRADGSIVAQFSSIDPKLGQAVSEVHVLQQETIVFIIFISTTEAQWQLSQKQFQRLVDTFKVLDTKPITTVGPTEEPLEWALIGPQSNVFGFFYPDNWQIIRQDENSVAVGRPDTNLVFEATVMEWAGSDEAAAAALKTAQQYVEKLGQDNKDVQSRSPEKFQLDQMTDGATIDFLYTNSAGKTVAGSIITAASQGKIYQVVFSAPAELYQSALDWFNPMYKSFKVLPAEEILIEQP